MESNISNNVNDSDKIMQMRNNMESLVKKAQETTKINAKKDSSKSSATTSSDGNYAAAVLQDTKVRNLLQKVARGDKLTKEEEQMIEDDSELEQKVEKLKRKKSELERELKTASSEQRKNILNSMVYEMSGKGEYTDEDLATMQLIQQYMYKYKDDMQENSQDNEEQKNTQFIASNVHYDYLVD